MYIWQHVGCSDGLYLGGGRGKHARMVGRADAREIETQEQAMDDLVYAFATQSDGELRLHDMGWRLVEVVKIAAVKETVIFPMPAGVTG